MEKIVVVGSLNVDLVGVAEHLPAPGETVQGSNFFQAPGGKGANQAYAASLLGGTVTMLGRVGDDEHGRYLRAGLLAGGCDVSHVKAVDGPSGVALILLSETGQNSILVAPGANGRYLPADLEADAGVLSDAALLLLQLETPIETVTAAAGMARNFGARVILDPAPAPSALPTALCRNVDVLTPNELEAARLLGSPALRLSPSDARDMANALLASGVGAVIIKLGAQGCLLAQGKSTELIAAPSVDVVDTTAAGDVFNAALAVAMSEHASLPDACRFAVHAAALSVTRLGAQPSMPRRAEVDRWISSLNGAR